MMNAICIKVSGFSGFPPSLVDQHLLFEIAFGHFVKKKFWKMWRANRAIVHIRRFSSAVPPAPKAGKKELPLRTLVRQSLLESSNLKIFVSHLWPKDSFDLKVHGCHFSSFVFFF